MCVCVCVDVGSRRGWGGCKHRVGGQEDIANKLVMTGKGGPQCVCGTAPSTVEQQIGIIIACQHLYHLSMTETSVMV